MNAKLLDAMADQIVALVKGALDKRAGPLEMRLESLETLVTGQREIIADLRDRLLDVEASRAAAEVTNANH